MQRIFQLLQLVFHHGLLHLVALWQFCEAVVRHDDTVVIVVLHAVEECHTILAVHIMRRCKENLRLRIGSLIGLGNSTHIGFHAYNHRLVNQPQPLHLMCCHTHNQRLASTYLMVTDTATILYKHPDTVFL